MVPGIFKAYDVRGVFPEEINEDAVMRIGEALGRHFRGKSGKVSAGGGSPPKADVPQEHASGGKNKRNPTVIVGHDARISSPALYAALIAALKKIEGLALIEAGLITTPMLYFLVNDENAEGGVMVTASHNPKEFNGLKVVGKGAVPIPGTEIKALLDSDGAKG